MRRHIEPAICYLHGATGFPTKATWLKDIRDGNYLSWHLINVKNVNKFFPESEDTQKGHMRTQRQGVRSTKAASQQAGQLVQSTDDLRTRLSADHTGYSPPNKTANSEEPEALPIPNKKDIFIAIYKTRNTIYTDQTGKFLHT